MENLTSSKEVQIRQLLLLEHRASHKPDQALKNVKAKIGQCDLTLEIVKFWFKRFDKGDTSLLKAKVPSYYVPQIVPNDKYLMSDNCKFRAVFDPLMNKKIISNGGRIGIVIGFKKLRHNKLFVIDLLHGDSREVYKAECLIGIKEESVVPLAFVDEEHLLVFNNKKCQLSLLKFDSDLWQFKLCSQVNVGRDFDFLPKLLLDELDKRKFLLSTWGSDFLAGSVVGDTIVINRQFSLQNVQYNSIQKYVGSKLFNVQRQSQNSELVELDLDTLERTLTDAVPSILDTGESLSFNAGGHFADHVWHEDWIYVAVEYPIKLTKDLRIQLGI